MWRLIKVVLILVLLAGITLIAYAYGGPLIVPDHFTPPARTIVAPVTLELD